LSFIPTKSGKYYCLITGDYCNTKTGCFTYIVSSSEDDELAEMTIYPNPSNGIVEINSSITIDQIELIDMHGRLVFGTQYLDKNKHKSLNFEHISAGQYNLKIVAGQNVIIKKLVITK
jgi:hypothetical protein